MPVAVSATVKCIARPIAPMPVPAPTADRPPGAEATPRSTGVGVRPAWSQAWLNAAGDSGTRGGAKGAWRDRDGGGGLRGVPVAVRRGGRGSDGELTALRARPGSVLARLRRARATPARAARRVRHRQGEPVGSLSPRLRG